MRAMQTSNIIDQRLIPNLFAIPAHHRGDLRIEQGMHHLAAQLQQDFEVVAVARLGLGHGRQRRPALLAHQADIGTEGELPQLATAQNGPAAANFSEWLKQTIEKRNGK